MIVTADKKNEKSRTFEHNFPLLSKEIVRLMLTYKIWEWSDGSDFLLISKLCQQGSHLMLTKIQSHVS